MQKKFVLIENFVEGDTVLFEAGEPVYPTHRTTLYQTKFLAVDHPHKHEIVFIPFTSLKEE